MSLWYQTLLVFGLALLVLGYFQYRRSGDVLKVGQELARPSYWVPAIIIAVAYVVLKLLFSGLAKIL